MDTIEERISDLPVDRERLFRLDYIFAELDQEIAELQIINELPAAQAAEILKHRKELWKIPNCLKYIFKLRRF